VVVVGAGFAGLLAAHFLAAAHGCRVEVYDKRAHPGPLPMRAGDEDEDDRAFALSMNVRGSAAVAAAGLDPDFAEVPGAHMALVRDQVMARGDGLPARGGDRGSTLTVPFAQPRVVGSRQAFVRALLHQIERAAAARGGGGGIAFAWGASFVSADLAARTATFQLGDGSTVVRPYDLLVGADGYYSRVRRAAAAQAPQLVVETSPPNRQYKVVRGLRPVAHLPLGPVPGSGGCGRMYMVQEAAAGLRGAGGGAPATLFLSQPSEECGVTAVLTMAHPRWQGLQGREQYARLLAASFPSLPPAWAEEVSCGTAATNGTGGGKQEEGRGETCCQPGLTSWRAVLPGCFFAAQLVLSPPMLPPSPPRFPIVEQMSAQLAVRPLFETGMQARCSQLHAAGLVLLGDAAHAVSPATSNGMNSALEDALVLSAVRGRRHAWGAVCMHALPA
jgi:kynurenine 3-monooxygenase